MKLKRHTKILELIEKHSIETQEELSEHLVRCGFDITQATISRDIKELKLVKALDKNDSYRYRAMDNESSYVNRLRDIFRASVLDIDIACNTVVIKSMPGLASAVAMALDTLHMDDIVGTIAGDDTVFVLTRDNNSAKKFKVDIEKNIR